MERTIDRTSYRRNARESIRRNEKENKKFTYLNILLNQIIVSLLIVIFVLVANYFDIIQVEKWINDNLYNKGYTITEMLSAIKKNLKKEENIVLVSGDNSGLFDELIKESGEVSGENVFKTAVEGINQMSEDAKKIKEKYTFVIPVKGIVTSDFGCRISSSKIVSSYHTGLDIAANAGTTISAAHSGKVILAETFSSYGKCIMIENNELVTLYAHCSSINVKEGQNVAQGEMIGKVGMTGNATGPHLHFEVKYEDRYVNPKDILGDI